jgi:hypothetical protein
VEYRVKAAELHAKAQQENEFGVYVNIETAEQLQKPYSKKSSNTSTFRRKG